MLFFLNIFFIVQVFLPSMKCSWQSSPHLPLLVVVNVVSFFSFFLLMNLFHGRYFIEICMQALRKVVYWHQPTKQPNSNTKYFMGKKVSLDVVAGLAAFRKVYNFLLSARLCCVCGNNTLSILLSQLKSSSNSTCCISLQHGGYDRKIHL